jgi:hypothetical protein
MSVIIAVVASAGPRPWNPKRAEPTHLPIVSRSEEANNATAFYPDTATNIIYLL